MNKLITCAFVLAIVGTCLVLATESEGWERQIITKKIHYPDPLLEYDFTMTEYPTPPPYDPAKRVDPFEIVKAEQEKVLKPGVAVPETPLTKWRVSQLELTSVIVNHVFAYAYFNTPKDARVYRGEVGNYVGKYGATITKIEPGSVILSDGESIMINR